MPSIALRFILLLTATIGLLSWGESAAFAQEKPASEKSQPKTKKKRNKKAAPFQWLNPIKDSLKKQLPKTLRQATFPSPSLKIDVGYCIYLPSQYNQKAFAQQRFPVVYYLHGGRPGNETKSVRIANFIDEYIQTKKLPPVIYVFVNGGPVSHYNLPNQPEAQGADIFIKELIPHIDNKYRTIAARKGRGLEGFSQGGRGTGRLMFRYPELFCSASPGGGGHATEKRISASGGFENDNLRFHAGDNTWDLAKIYAQKLKDKPDGPTLNILVHVGKQGFNYENNLAWMKHLTTLGIKHRHVIVPGVGHSATGIYEKSGEAIFRFHCQNFGILAE